MKYFTLVFCLSVACSLTPNSARATPEEIAKPLTYKILSERTHKASLFTQGLLINDGKFYESSGLYGKSLLVSYPIKEPDSTWAKMTAPFTQKQLIPERYFAEGLTLLNKKLYLLTWQEGALFIFNAENFSLASTLYYKGEGWGLTTDGKQLIRSDGSATLFFHNPDNFTVTKSISVTQNKTALTNLNELEFFDGYIWANIWHNNHIVKIDPNSGEVVGAVDLSGVVKQLALTDSESVLNGLAYDAEKKALWITGKQWPKMYLIKIQ